MNEEAYKFKCKCGNSGLENELDQCLQEFGNGTIHVRATCPKCYQFIKYLAYGKSKLVSSIVRLAFYGNYGEIDDIMCVFDEKSEDASK